MLRYVTAAAPGMVWRCGTGLYRGCREKRPLTNWHSIYLRTLCWWQNLGIEVLNVHSSPNGTVTAAPSPGDDDMTMIYIIVGSVVAVAVVIIVIIVAVVLRRRASKLVSLSYY